MSDCAKKYKPIGDYGLIGNLETVALVGIDGSIDFMCFPRFDSPSIFAALLDHDKGGSFKIAPVLTDAQEKQLYLPDTNILLTRFLASDGVAELSDFMPIASESCSDLLVRRAKTVRGELAFRMICDPRLDYGRAKHRAELCEGGALFVSLGNDGTALRLRSERPVILDNGAAIAEFVLRAGESAAFVLEDARPGHASPATAEDYVATAFKDTMNYWRRWMGQATYQGRWREMVHRSALALKLMTSRRYGSIVASPTFGLPEVLGGTRNWDYRYTWIRDASFTLYAFLRLGLTEEAAAFMTWIEHRCNELAPDGSLQVMYGIDGRHTIREEVLPNLEGYRCSPPVRIGNDAYKQLQLDISGELMDAVYLHNKYGRPIHYDLWRQLVRLVDWVCNNWQQDDEGIWEVRGGKKPFLYSRLMCWVAIDRAIRQAARRSFPAPLEHWYAERDKIYCEIFTEFWSDERKAFVQHKGSQVLDAATLLMPLVRFISPVDPRWLSTLRAIDNELLDDSLVYRYRPAWAAPDGLMGDEGTFSMCTFWYVECLSRAGDLDKARFYFEKMLGYANHVGLYGEELGPRGEHLGNFPQAFTHLALISAAYDLDRRISAHGRLTT